VAQKVQTLYIDDIDDIEATGTVRFGLDGANYEIDLNTEHTDELHTALRTYINHARKVGGTSRRAPRARRADSAIDTTAIRAWAREQASKSRTAAACPQTSSPSTTRQLGSSALCRCVRRPPAQQRELHQARMRRGGHGQRR
jgi:Lsr2